VGLGKMGHWFIGKAFLAMVVGDAKKSKICFLNQHSNILTFHYPMCDAKAQASLNRSIFSKL
jgi:hypothetical protein